MPTRKKLIVYLTNNDGFDDSCAVLAEQMDNGYVRITGHQLHVIADPESRQFINKDSYYYIYSTYYRVKCYDCFTFNQLAQQIEPTADPRYILRCHGYHPKTGHPGFTPEEAIKAGLPEGKVALFTSPKTGLLHIKPGVLQAC
ncbi:MAG: hypothetical protein Tp1100MES1331091_3 [Prokaryotic dsDNA virus sp.]|nr:MAG: hypothetical protein Tp1100MES1331091_3 [Prokaryotic dsDNA virus sp.]|tara:strand:- start:2992 stop:3420 length:429 start_codon:yes stop_codon:yes gene_type:complete